VFGNIEIGNNVTIGANSVVTTSIPSHSTVVASVITVLEKDLSENYIHNRY
jgi:serine O-acetyltransferase